jgi:uroporphyrinogen-III synthase
MDFNLAGSELEGKTVLVTRAPDQASAISDALKDRGAAVVELPTIQIVPPSSYEALDGALRDIERYAMLLLGSRNAVDAVVARAKHLGVVIPRPVGCVGERTRTLVEEALDIFQGATVAPSTYRAEALIPVIADYFDTIRGLRFLHPRAPEGRELLKEALEQRGAIVEQVEAYRIRPADPVTDPAVLAALEPVDIVTFLSGETLAAFMTVVPGAASYLAKRKVAVIGPVAKKRADALGVRVDIVPQQATVEDLVDALGEL